MCYEEIEYKDKQDMIDRLVGKKIIDWSQDYLKLDDGTVITIEMTESDCCAIAYGEFKDIRLEAVITDIRFNKPVLNRFDGDGKLIPHKKWCLFIIKTR